NDHPEGPNEKRRKREHRPDLTVRRLGSDPPLRGTGPGAQCSSSGNCFTDGVWDRAQCPDPESCAANCALESVTLDDYRNTYGVSAVPGGVELGFVRGPNVGSRLYVLEKPNEYKLFKLLNKEFTFDVDVSTLACGINGAL
ncbi:unnamed protein product, partial [Prorocentrum cordatum]